MLMRVVATLIAIVVATACSPSREAPATGANPVRWSASAASFRTTGDGSPVIDIALRATIDDGWHVYSLTQGRGGPVPMTVKVAPVPIYELAEPVTGPAADRALDPNFGIETETYSGQPVFRVVVKQPAATQPAAQATPIELKVRSQACSDILCLPARTTTLSIAPPRIGS